MAIDPWHCHITNHALERYMERRGWPQSYAYRTDAEATIRTLLARVAHKNPPVKQHRGRMFRTYEVGHFRFVVSSDNTTVITCYPIAGNAQKRRRFSRAARRARASWA